jgi:hypothetical protein
MPWVCEWNVDRYADTSGAANDVYEFVCMSNFYYFLKNFIVTFFLLYI